MTTLPELLTSEKKDQVVEDCCSLIDAEVKDKGGISGLAIKAGYGAVKGIKPGFVRTVVHDLLPEFAQALDPVLLAITDAKAARSKSGVVKGTYDKLRNSAKKNVEAAVPRLGEMVQKYAP
jgi:hypothetical protein